MRDRGQYAGNGRFIPEAELDQYEDGERFDSRRLPNKIAQRGPTHRCPVCATPYWIERECTGTFNHATGERLPHEPTTAVKIPR